MRKYSKTLVIFILLLFTVPCLAQERIVEASGEAVIVGNNAIGARSQALADAFRNAVEKGIGVYVKSQTIMQNYQLISDNIFSQAKGYVTDHEILSEGQRGNNYAMTIRATVNTAQLSTNLKTLGILKNLLGDPKIMSMIQEVSVSSQGRVIIEDAASSIALEEELNIAGFTLVDREQVNKIRSREIEEMGEFFMDKVFDDPLALERIREAAQEAGAQYLLMGSGLIESKSAPGNVVMSTATFKCKIVDSSTGEKIALTQAIETGAGNTYTASNLNAGARAGNVASEKILPQIINDWQDKFKEGVPYIIKLYGITSYASQGRKFQRAVKNVAGITNCTRRAWIKKAGRMELDIKYKGNGDDLIDAILDAVSTIPGFDTIDIQGQAGNNVNFTL